MGAVRLRIRSQLRARWRAWLVVVLLAGIGGGTVIGALDGARRSENAYPDFVEAHDAMDVLVPGKSPFGLVGAVDLQQVVRLPQVASVADGSATLLFTGRTDRGRLIGPGDVFPLPQPTQALGTSMERFKILDGRAARPFALHEATASFLLAEQLGLHVGSTVRLHFFSAQKFDEVAFQLLGGFGPRLESGAKASAADLERLANGPDLTFRIVGIEASPSEFPPLPTDIVPPLHLTPAFYERYNDDLVQSPLAYVKLRRGVADLPAFTRAVEDLGGSKSVSFVTTKPNQLGRVQREIRLEAAALRIFAAVTLLAFGVVVVQALSRQLRAQAEDDPTLRALGVRTRGFLALGMIPAVVAGALAAVLAAIVATLVSPIAIVGLARTADLHPGIQVSPLALVAGSLAVFVAVPLLALGPAWRRARAARTTPPPRRTAPRWLRITHHLRVGPTAAIGTHFALDPGQGPTAVPVRSTIVGFTIVVALLTAVLGFSSSLTHLLDTPSQYGWTWDIRTGAPALPDLGAVIPPALANDHRVQAFSSGSATQMVVDGTRVDVLAMERNKGDVGPLVTSGRAPVREGEVLLGIKTLRKIGAHNGSTVTATIGDQSRSLRVVGTGVFPGIGDGGVFGSGTFVTYETLRSIQPDTRHNVFFIRFAPGVDEHRAFEQVRAALQPLPSRQAQRPSDLDNLARLDGLQAALALVLAALAAATLANTLVSSVRRRRRELAVLKSVGFSRRQAGSTIAWEAAVLAAIGVVIGIGAGTLAARLIWTAFADNLGIENVFVFPTTAVLVLVPAAFVAALVVALWPAIDAARTSPSAVLHAE